MLDYTAIYIMAEEISNQCSNTDKSGEKHTHTHRGRISKVLENARGIMFYRKNKKRRRKKDCLI